MDAIDVIPKFKFQALVNHAKQQEATIATLQAKLNQCWYYSDENVWYWQGDGTDHLESLTCPVVITAEDLRALIARS